MVGTGLRVDECLNLHFEDIKMIDRQKTKSIIEKEIKLNENERYYLQIWVRKSKTKNDGVSLFHQRTSHIND